MEEIEDLWALAEECREWMNKLRETKFDGDPLVMEFKRLAEKIDWIARRLAKKETSK